MIGRMPGTNLTRDEAATRAALLDVTSYTIDLDLTTGEKTFASTTTLEFSCREPGATTFADLWRAAGGTADCDPDFITAAWRKLLVNAVAGLMVLTGRRSGRWKSPLSWCGRAVGVLSPTKQRF